MLIAIDYDNTITLEPNMWLHFAVLAKEFGHTCIVVTGRTEEQPISHFVAEKFDRVIYCGDEYKSTATKRLGFKVDVWIDDEPGHIEPSRKLEFS